MTLFNIPASSLLYPAGYQSVPGARKIYVRSTPMDLSPVPDQDRRNTLAAALPLCRAGAGDEIHVLPGHSENVASATFLSGLKAGTRIFGHGPEGFRPVFRWTDVAGNWALNVPGVEICGLRLRMEGANGITSGFTVTAADCAVRDCDIEVASGATSKAAIMGTVGAGADRFRFIGNRVRGTETHNVTDGLLISSAVRETVVARNLMVASATAGNGLVRFSAAALGSYVGWNAIYNTHTASTVCVAYGNVAVDGILEYNRFGILTNGTPPAGGVSFGAAALIKSLQNFTCDAAALSGFLSPGVST